MSGIYYSIAIGQPLEAVVASTYFTPVGPPAAGSVWIVMDQTAGAITDSSYPGGSRMLKKSEIQQLMRTLEQYLIRDTNIS